MIKKEVLDYKERIFYVCGPPGMVDAMEELIGNMGIALAQLKLETLIGHV